MARDAVSDADALGKLPLLEFLPPAVRAEVARRFVRASYPFGAVIVRENDPADAMYVLVSGRARVVKRGDTGEEVPLNVLRAGDAFGEMALLEQTTRVATVRASSDVEALRLDRSAFEALLVSAPDLKKYLELQASHRRLHNFFRSYTAFARLPVECAGRHAGRAGVGGRGAGRDRHPRGRPTGADVRRRGGSAARVRGGGRRAALSSLSPARRLLRRALAVQARGALDHRRGGDALPAASPGPRRPSPAC
jgi:Cyclic nucleotide-binding domain